MTYFLIGLVIIGGLTAFIYFVGPYFPGLHVYTEIDIDASPADVYAVLADLERYPEWNPYHVVVEGRAAVGEALVVHVNKPNGDTPTVHPHMLRMEPSRELTWGGGVRGLFIGEHVFLLEENSAGGTRLIHKEDFEGIAVQFVPLDAIEEGYNGMNVALKAWIEGSR